MAGDEYSIADMAIAPWYGHVARGEAYGDAATFLSGHEYTHVLRWAEAFNARPAVKRGRMVNRPFGDPAGQLLERHDASDFELRTQDKIIAAAEAAEKSG
jgi:GST-like protein